MKKLFIALLLCASSAAAQTPEQQTAQYFAKARNNPLLLHAFLWKMPKGGDLHNHLSGAAYAEHFIQIAADKHLCVDRKTATVSSGTCDIPQGNECDPTAQHVPAKCALRDGLLYRQLLTAWSMYDFVPQEGESGHDHFFDTFGRFGAASNSTADLLVEVASRAATQNEQYLELMLTPGIGAASGLGAALGWRPLESQPEEAYFDATRQQLTANGLAKVVSEGRAWLDQQETAMRQQMRCDSDRSQPGCKITVRYIAQILRGLPKEVVFAQLAASFELAKQDKRVVSVNPVMPEDGYTSMQDYDLHMRMFAYFHKLYPEVKLTMHAGELAPGLVPPDGLTFHIREALEVAGAQRIGHGVDVMYEDRPFDLLREMAQKKVAVEICLTSNDVILGVRGNQHPFPLYRKYGVPTVLATDDEGVSRSDMTREYQRAVETYALTYADVKQLARNSIQYSFASQADKTKLKAQLETAFHQFERDMAKKPD